MEEGELLLLLLLLSSLCPNARKEPAGGSVQMMKVSSHLTLLVSQRNENVAS